MKKLLVVLTIFLLITGFSVAAGISLGPSVLNSSGIPIQQLVDDPSFVGFGPEDLSYGVEARAVSAFCR